MRKEKDQTDGASPAAQKFIQDVTVKGQAEGGVENMGFNQVFEMVQSAAKNSGSPEKDDKENRDGAILDGFFTDRDDESDDEIEVLPPEKKDEEEAPKNESLLGLTKRNGGLGQPNGNKRPIGRQRERPTYADKRRMGGRKRDGACASPIRTTRAAAAAPASVDAAASDDEKAASYASSTAGNKNGNQATMTRKGLFVSKKRNTIDNIASTPHGNGPILDELLAQAEFELEHDVYRGMALEKEDPAAKRNPWANCQSSVGKYKKNQTSNNEIIQDVDEITKDDIDGRLLAKALLEETLHSNCPSLIQLTQDSILKQRQAAKKKRGKKRKQPAEESETPPPDVGQRPLDPNGRCPCDYNPHCIVSLGGVVNDIWKEGSERVFKKKKEQHQNLQEMMRAQQNQVQLPALSVNSGNHPYAKLHSAEKKTPESPEPMIIDVTDAKSPKAVCSDDEVVEVINETDSVTPLTINDGIDYATETADKLSRLRPCTMVETKPIQEYLERVLYAAPIEALNEGLSVPKLFEIFKQWHASLIFSNPHRDVMKSTDSRLPIALPPGISNLGATCYLNTQLQCLAQNKAFLKGIAKWRAAEKNGDGSTSSEADRHSEIMNNVLTSLQSLMAEMVEGSERSVTTLNFSTALGLEHGEQQDPNEFARLLFERMHDAFQQQESVRNLLPSLFEGNTTYYTTCQACKNVSTRRESFMDLNLPIVKLPQEEEDSGGVQKVVNKCKKKITDFFGIGNESAKADMDTTLQYCLDEYSTVEELKGDNQYFCSRCGCKQDATRETALGKVPPVLNVQLSRYVFDMTTFTKKKLTDKVLLPRKLSVRTKVSDAVGDASEEKTYILCAVMKHIGGSAYRGHYVAEVQDFLSGQWFEFNDEKVTLLEDGPSCSYMPTTTIESEDTEMPDADAPETKKKKKKAPKIVGSEEAYNTYYVEEKYLSATVIEAFEALETQQKELQAVGDKKKEPTKHDVLQSVALEREVLFKGLSELCLIDGEATTRVRERKRKLKTDVLTLNKAANPNDKPVWVDATLLRSFVSGDRLEDLFRTPGGEPLLQHKGLLCMHGKGLHPRIARRGKLLPRHMYDSYENLIASERCRFLGIDNDSAKRDPQLWDKLNDHFLYPHNLQCKECEDTYRVDLREKLNRVKLLRYLYVELDAKNGSGNIPFPESLHFSDSESEDEDDGLGRYAYVVAKKSLTALRKKIETDLLKGLSAFMSTTANSSPAAAVGVDLESEAFTSVDDVNVESLSEGLDALDLSMFNFDNPSNSQDFDVRINSSIICAHGNYQNSTKKNQIRWLSGDVWEALKKLLPNAIEHKVLRNGKDADKPCPECEKETKSRENLEGKLVEWHRNALSPLERKLRDIYEEKTGRQGLAQFYRFSEEGGDEADICRDIYIPVVRSDVSLWRKMVKAVEVMKKRKEKDAPLVKVQLESLLNEQRPDWGTYTNKPLEDCFFQSLRCQESGCCVPIFEEDEASEEKSDKPRGILLLTNAQYDSILGSVADMLKILSGVMEDGDVIDLSDEDSPKKPALSDRLMPPRIIVTPPVAEPGLDYEGSEGSDIRIVAPSGEPVYLSCHPKFCDHQDCTCRETYINSLERDDEEKSIIGEKADDPVVILDSDGEDDKGNFKLKVFEVKADEDINAALATLMELDELPGLTQAPPSEDAPRRSTRRRKSRFPFGAIERQHTVEVAMQHNIAALRLLLFQTCEDKFKLDERLTLVFSPESSEGKKEEANDVEQDGPLYKEIPFESNKEELKDFYASWTDDAKLERLADPSKSLMLLRQTDNEKDSSVPHESLMDALLESANTISNDHDDGKKSSKPAERGFSGTLLSSFRPATGDTSSTSNQSNAKENGAKESSTEPSKEASKKCVEEETDNKSPKRKATGRSPHDPTSVDEEGSTHTEHTEESPEDRGGDKSSKEGRNDSALEDPTVAGRRKRRKHGPATSESVLATVGLDDDSKLLSEVLESLQEVLGREHGEKFFQVAHWAVENKGGKTLEAIKEMAINRFFTV